MSLIVPAGVDTVTIAVERSASSISTRMSAVVHTWDFYARSVLVATMPTRTQPGASEGAAPPYPLNTLDKFTRIPAVAPQMCRPSCGST